MRRQRRIPQAGPGPNERRGAQRFPIRTTLRYRLDGEKEWRNGTTENISSSGLLFRGERLAEPNARVEMNLVVPAGAPGSGAANVTCHGAIVRTEDRAGGDQSPVLAISILHYRIMRP